MKLGICYMVFDGEELLEPAIKSIRKEVDYVSVTYQSISYWGNLASSELEPYLITLKEKGLIDNLIHYKTDLSLTPKQNELILRNIGRESSEKAGCTHHISADVDEFYLEKELQTAKKITEDNNYDFVSAYMHSYYKNPCWRIYPDQKLYLTFIHKIENKYIYRNPEFPYSGELTRNLSICNKYKILDKKDIMIHHMSFVRKDIRKKYMNNDNKNHIKLEEFYEKYDKYKLGERLNLLPDYINRKTILVENIFDINI